MRIFIFLLILLFPEVASSKIEKGAPWEIRANILSYDAKTKTYFAKGDVILKKGENYLYAESVSYNEKTGIAKLKGNIWFETPDQIMVAEEGVMNLKDQTGTLKKSCIFIKGGNYYISGDEIKKVGKDKYIIKGCSVTTCASEKPAWSLRSSEVEVSLEGYGKAKSVVFKVKGVPVFYIPYIMFSTKKERQTGLLPPKMGYIGRNGFSIELPFYLAISENTDMTLYQRYMQKRGYMQGIEIRHIRSENSRFSFLFDILSDRSDKYMTDEDDLELSPYRRTNKTRYWLRGKLDQELPFDMMARLDLDYISDQDYLLEFERGLFGFDARTDLQHDLKRPMDEIRSPTRRTSLRISRDLGDYSLQFSSSYYQRPEHLSEDRTPEPFAELYFQSLQKPLFSSIFYSLKAKYSYIWRETGDRGNSFTFSPEINLPLWLKDVIEFEPYFRYEYTGQFINREIGSCTYQSKYFYETGARISLKAGRSFFVDWNGVDKLTHYIWPEITYRYRETKRKYVPWFEEVDEEGDVNLINFSLKNFLDARITDSEGNISYRQWIRLNLNQGYDFNGYEEDRHFTPLFMDLIATPFSNIDIRGNFRWDHYDTEIKSALFSATVYVPRERGEKDTYKIDYVYREGEKESLEGYFDINLKGGFAFGSSFELEMRTDTTVSNSYWLRYRSQCWEAKFQLKRQDEQTSFGIGFHLLGLGDISH